MKNFKVWLDGEFYDEKEAKVSVFDHGLLYGDGVFEGIRIYNGRVFYLREHLERLYDSAKAIWMKIPMEIDAMEKMVVETCRINELREGYIRLVVTRGFGDLGLNPTKCPKPTIFCIAKTIQLYPKEFYEKGLRVITCPTQRNGVAQVPPMIKSLSYLNNIMGQIEATNAGAQEAFMLNAQGYVAECTGDNVFVVKNGQMFTPPISAGSLKGITRKIVMDLVKQSGREVVETDLSRYDLFVADEIFLTGTGAEVVPVAEVDGRKIGESIPGPVTKDVLARFRQLTQSAGVPIYS
jgi:branched-chain amino acid aminotransferase